MNRQYGDSAYSSLNVLYICISILCSNKEDEFNVNSNDIESAQKYLAEIEKHRNSIIAAGPMLFDYYWDNPENGNMQRLEYKTGNDGDIEEEEQNEVYDDTVKNIMDLI